MSNENGWPWGSNDPGRSARAVVASVVALLAVAVVVWNVQRTSGHTDFSHLWFAAKSLAEGRNPYDLIGPGREWESAYRLYYPASSLVFVLPFTLLSEVPAVACFVGLSVWLLVWGVTHDGWHRLPIIASAAFLESVLAAQWTVIITAAFFLPWLCFVTPAKPQTGLAVLVSTWKVRPWIYAGISAIAGTTVALVLLPSWPSEWLESVGEAGFALKAVRHPVGLLALLVLLRWRRRESWLIVATVLLPQTFMWYGGLLLLAVANTYREAVALSAISTLGFLAAVYATGWENAPTVTWSLYLATTLLPAAFVVIRRPNESPD